MFSTLGLFDVLPCPDKHTCTRVNCIFSHRSSVVEQPIRVLADAPVASSSSAQPDHAPSSSARSSTQIPQNVPAKRPLASQLQSVASSNCASSSREPPRKLQKTGPLARPVAVPTATHTPTGVPLIRVPPPQSQVAIPVRQAMLKTLYEHFQILYAKIIPANPTLASEHALRQEQEVYDKSNKLTYRHAVISSVAALKRREQPDSAGHRSVGTEGDIAARVEARKKLDALRLTAAQLEPYVLTPEELLTWGYVIEVPEGAGGTRPAELGGVKTCERCKQPFMVKRREEAEECTYHWGRAFTTKAGGEKRRVYSCCEREPDSEGCSQGPHVFYESAPEDLHLRHSFTVTRPPDDPEADTALDIVALDCEMVYTTGGFRVARVSVVDAAGQQIFDELVRMDDGVEVIDFNTRFSGITPEEYAEKAVLPLASIRRSLDTLVSARTIVVGHALENDLKTLRMVHLRCVDTVALFPHQSGPPYRRALRFLVKEHLGQTIQSGGGTTGHSSVEDAIATLDLVRWHLLNRPKPPAKSSGTPAVG